MFQASVPSPDTRPDSGGVPKHGVRPHPAALPPPGAFRRLFSEPVCQPKRFLWVTGATMADSNQNRHATPIAEIANHRRSNWSRQSSVYAVFRGMAGPKPEDGRVRAGP